jgi:hypothetical protein
MVVEAALESLASSSLNIGLVAMAKRSESLLFTHKSFTSGGYVNGEKAIVE